MDSRYTQDSPEQWKPIPGFDGYFASTEGRIASTRHRRRDQGWLVLKPQMHSKLGYWYVFPFTTDKVRKARSIHGLVTATFLGPRPEGQVVRHLDGDRTNPKLSNLSYGSYVDNEADKVRHGRRRSGTEPICHRGHAMDEKNTRYTTGAKRRCRTCDRENTRIYRARVPRASSSSAAA